MKIHQSTACFQSPAFLAVFVAIAFAITGCGDKAATTVNMEAPMSSQEEVDAYAADQAKALRERR